MAIKTEQFVIPGEVISKSVEEILPLSRELLDEGQRSTEWLRESQRRAYELSRFMIIRTGVERQVY